MNIVSVMVSMSIVGASAPMMLDMSLAPIVAQKRALNFGVAETSAVTYAAANEGSKLELTAIPDGCDVTELGDLAYSITCVEGENTQFTQSVTRAFRMATFDPDGTGSDSSDACEDGDGNNGHGNSNGFDCSNPGRGGYANNARVFAYAAPDRSDYSGHQCTSSDPWGVNGWWKTTYPTLGMCVPDELRTRQAYLDSDPANWYYDATTYGWGEHPLY